MQIKKFNLIFLFIEFSSAIKISPNFSITYNTYKEFKHFTTRDEIGNIVQNKLPTYKTGIFYFILNIVLIAKQKKFLNPVQSN